jgi:hypothetical protein
VSLLIRKVVETFHQADAVLSLEEIFLVLHTETWQDI